ncbi:MAG: hypothetical protein A3G75_14875 [Verrucomicrobia bacterium RIFCSPLOWO2_12_FULL_64_8]|nr:MAG: hypothetical protein A3G75_14875 [Verrucomicrobia bacterium RIFCSPLOWO2_12_FULL_64_8]
MHKKLLAWVALSAFAMILSLGAYAQQVPGSIKALRVTGSVSVTHGDGTTEAVANNMTIAQSDIVVTAKGASVVLVFSNASTINLGDDSRLEIKTYLTDPFSQAINVGAATEEPMATTTALNLTYGELVGNVKKLKSTSTYSVQTPVGAAGIRGTIFRIVFRPTGTGQAFFAVSTVDGEVIYTGMTGTDLQIPLGQEVTVTVEINDATGQVVGTPTVTSTTPISNEAMQAIQAAATQAAQEAAAVVISPPPPPEPPPPPPPPPQPNTTPGEGGAG